MAGERPRLLVADKKGRVYDVPFLEATGMKGYFNPSRQRMRRNDRGMTGETRYAE